MNQEERTARSIQGKICELEKLATFEPVAFHFMSYAQDENVSLSELARWIAIDPILTSRVLKLANSSAYGFRGQISTVNLATVIIGLKALRELVWSISVMDQFTDQQKLIDQRELVNLWLHSNYTGIAARYLAELAGYPATGEAFVAGLLHDIGYQVFAQQFPEIFYQIVECSRIKRISYRQAEQELEGFNHSEVGAWLGEAWGFPAAIVQAIRFHHRAEENDHLLVTFVHLADLMAHSLSERSKSAPRSFSEISEGELLSGMKKIIRRNGHELSFYQERVLQEGEKLNELFQDSTLMVMNV